MTTNTLMGDLCVYTIRGAVASLIICMLCICKSVKMNMNNKTPNDLRANEGKWSKTLMEAGWTVLPTILIEGQRKMNLDPIDMNILLHLASYWWQSDKKPHPSKKTIATAMNVHPRTVQRHIADLEKKQLIKREQRRLRGGRSETNLYHFDGLIAAALPFAKEKIQQKKWRIEALKRQALPASSSHGGKN